MAASPFMTQGPSMMGGGMMGGGAGMMAGGGMMGMMGGMPNMFRPAARPPMSPLAAGIGKSAEHDPLLPKQRAFGPDGLPLAASLAEAEQRAAGKESAASWKILVASIFVPHFWFVMCILVFMLFYEHCYGLVLIFIAGMFGSFAVSHVRFSTAKKRPEAWIFAACAGAVLAGSLFGYYNYNQNLRDYWEYFNRREYTNVWPSELAEAHSDASAIVFAQGTKPDPLSAMGYNFGYATACVAPIRMTSSDSVEAVQFWAVGIDCCSPQQGDFTCGDIGNVKARAGLVVFNRSTPMFPLGMRTSADEYMQATQMATARYSITSAEEPVFVHWVHDINAAHSLLWWNALVFWFKSSLFAFAVCVFLATVSPHMVNSARAQILKRMTKTNL